MRRYRFEPQKRSPGRSLQAEREVKRASTLRSGSPGVLATDRARALELTPVSRETVERLDAYVALLLEWQRTTNLIATSTIPRLWTRHIADSLQLIDLAPGARVWADLGSGGGLPGLAIACALQQTPGAIVHLVESNTRKAAFLREAGRSHRNPHHGARGTNRELCRLLRRPVGCGLRTRPRPVG